jgi:hypothetical protein
MDVHTSDENPKTNTIPPINKAPTTNAPSRHFTNLYPYLYVHGYLYSVPPYGSYNAPPSFVPCLVIHPLMVLIIHSSSYRHNNAQTDTTMQLFLHLSSYKHNNGQATTNNATLN